MTMQNTTSNLVYVLGPQRLSARLVRHHLQGHRWSSAATTSTLLAAGREAGRKTPPNYLGFRFEGRLQRVHHVESYEVITQPHDYIPEIHPGRRLD